MDEDVFKKNLQEIVEAFVDKEIELFTYDVNERTISSKLAQYLSNYFNKYNVDCEYNRRGDELKRLPVPIETRSNDEDGKTIFPDILIHQRGKNEADSNLAIIEVKKSKNKDTDRDVEKLKALTMPEGGYHYSYGVHLTFDRDGKYSIDWYQNGSKC